jgi:hypothetical protein
LINRNQSDAFEGEGEGEGDIEVDFEQLIDIFADVHKNSRIMLK